MEHTIKFNNIYCWIILSMAISLVLNQKSQTMPIIYECLIPPSVYKTSFSRSGTKLLLCTRWKTTLHWDDSDRTFSTLTMHDTNGTDAEAVAQTHRRGQTRASRHVWFANETTNTGSNTHACLYWHCIFVTDSDFTSCWHRWCHIMSTGIS